MELKKIILIAFGLLLGLAAADYILGLTVINKLFYRINIEGSSGTYALSDDPKLVYLPKPGTGENNKYGYRGKEVTVKQDNNKNRAALIGDSVLHGFDVKQDERFSDILGARLAAEDEIINFGVSGYNLTQEAEYLEKKALRFRPKTVIFFTTCNDLATSSYEASLLDEKINVSSEADFYRAYYGARSYLSGALGSTSLYKLYLYAKIVDFKKPGGAYSLKDAYVDKKTLNDILGRLAALSKRSGFKLYFVLNAYNSPGNGYDETMSLIKKSLGEHGIAYLDVEEEFVKRFTEKGKNALLMDQWHLTVKGHQAVADILWEKRLQLGL